MNNMVEKVHAPILILSVERDTIWPSGESAEHMSHMMIEYCGSQIKYFIKSERKYPEKCAEERKEMGKEVFFNCRLFRGKVC